MNKEMTELSKIDVIKPIPKRACDCFSPSCLCCRQDALHPSPIHSNWASEEWDGDKAKAKEQKTLIDFDVPTQKLGKEHTTDKTKCPFIN